MRPALDAEDVLHDSLVQVLDRWQRHPHEGAGGLQQRVQLLAELRIREHARRLDHRLRPCPLHQLGEHQVPAAPGTWGAPGRGLAEEGELEQRIRREMAAMRVEHAWVLVLRTWFEASWDKVALVLDQPSEDAARSLYYRAQRDLAARLERGSGRGFRFAPPANGPLARHADRERSGKHRSDQHHEH